MSTRWLAFASAAFFVVLASPAPVPHCDGLDGPVVKAAQHALESGDVRPILIWVQPQGESEVRRAFEATLRVRSGGAAAKELADRFFFETVVRVHRAGEGAPYTGLEPAGRDLGPAIPAADQAVADGDVEPLLKLVHAAVERGMRERLEAVLHRKAFRPDDLAAGREYVKSYVEFIHYVEKIHDDAAAPAHGHFPEHAERHE